MIDHHGARLVPDSIMMRQNGLGGPVDTILDRPEADTEAQHRGAEGLDGLSAVAFKSPI